MKIVRKLMLSILALVSVVATFTVSTYAWFQVNSEAKVGGFEFKATGGLGFMISADGKTYANDLTSDQMKMAILTGYDSNRYEIKDNNLFDKTLGKALSENEINQSLKDTLLLSPVTSKNGLEFTNLSGTPVSKSSGKFIEFSLYFKATSGLVEDNLGYDIYLCGTDIEQMGGAIVKKTHIESNAKDTVDLLAKMTILDKNNTAMNLGPGESQKTIDVYSSNAGRLSIIEDKPKAEVPEGTTPEELPQETATIYEITNEFDLGSYATNYNSAADTSTATPEQKQELDRLYNSNYNAMFTYYNKLRPYSNLKPLEYQNTPKTVRDLTDEYIFTSVESGGPAKKVTFRFWLEGWDADCFDGLTKAINVRLLFNSKPKDMSK